MGCACIGTTPLYCLLDNRLKTPLYLTRQDLAAEGIILLATTPHTFGSLPFATGMLPRMMAVGMQHVSKLVRSTPLKHPAAAPRLPTPGTAAAPLAQCPSPSISSPLVTWGTALEPSTSVHINRRQFATHVMAGETTQRIPRIIEIPFNKELCNRVTLMGTLGRDPEVKTIPSGRTLAEMSIAVASGSKASPCKLWVPDDALVPGGGVPKVAGSMPGRF